MVARITEQLADAGQQQYAGLLIDYIFIYQIKNNRAQPCGSVSFSSKLSDAGENFIPT